MGKFLMGFVEVLGLVLQSIGSEEIPAPCLDHLCILNAHRLEDGVQRYLGLTDLDVEDSRGRVHEDSERWTCSGPDVEVAFELSVLLLPSEDDIR